jgi:Protein of unknown function (DUF3306)
MSDGSNFLSRWSRLKGRSQARHKPRSDGAIASDVGPPQTTGAGAGAGEADAAAPDLPPEELAALPRLEDFTPETDLTAFMRAGIPATLRNAALRRMWALDPAIRDRVGDALEYAYDWNSPGGVPGTGPLLASDDVEGMLRSIMGRSVAEQGAPEAPVGSAALKQPTSEEPRPVLDSSTEKAIELPAETPPPQHGTGPVTKPAAKESAPEDVVLARRHGRATPF